jgi:creatinine amidohydrolase
MRKASFLSIVALSLLPAFAEAISPGIHDVNDLTAPEIASLDRSHTLFLLPVGTTEEHGPHLAVGADTFQLESVMKHVLRRLQRELPGWYLVRMPLEPYGQGGANEIGGSYAYPGSYNLRASTLRAVVADVGSRIAQNGFRWIFVLHDHGSPHHSISLSEASDFVGETFGARMVNVTSTVWVDSVYTGEAERIARRHFTEAEIREIGMDIHAGTSETSSVLAVNPSKARPVYRRLPPLASANFAGLVAHAKTKGWPGYLSAPAKANAPYGRELLELEAKRSAEMILEAIRGQDLAKRLRYPAPLLADPAVRQVIQGYLAEEDELGHKLDRWLAGRKKN